MAILEEIWIKDIQEELYESNAFLTHSIDHSEYVNGTVVHLQEAGTVPGSVKNRTDFPAAPGERTDVATSYPVYSRTTDPVLVTDLEALQLSYAKRQSVLRQHMDTLLFDTGRDIAFEWCPTMASRMVRTSGASSADNLAAGATGTRKAITLGDVARLARMFDMDNVPGNGRFLMVHPVLYYELFSIADLLRMDVMGKTTLPTGVISQLFGFNVLVKPSVPTYTNAGTPAPKEPGSDSATTDNLIAMAWQQGCVARAIGTIEVYEKEKDPLYYGDLISARIFCGGTKLRVSEKGVGAVVQAS